MRSVVFCHAPGDLEIAREIGTFLELNLAVNCCYDEGIIHTGDELLDVVGRALSAELVVLLLSPDSVPSQWRQEAWKPVLLEQPREFGSYLVFALARQCQFPALLRRQPFCDFTSDRKSSLRTLKRLLFRYTAPGEDLVDLPAIGEAAEQDIEELRCSLADRPGKRLGLSRGRALAFAHAAAAEFEGAFWIDCVRYTASAILGEIANRLGLRLSGSFEQNRTVLRDFCNQRRCLFVLEHAGAEQAAAVTLGGWASVVTTADAGVADPMSLTETVSLFADWARQERQCLRFLGDANFHLQQLEARDASAWRSMQRLGSPLLALLKSQDRLAEANEVLEILLAGAEVQGDEGARRGFEWERSWILGHWGEPYVAAAVVQSPRETTQLGFNFE